MFTESLTPRLLDHINTLEIRKSCCIEHACVGVRSDRRHNLIVLTLFSLIQGRPKPSSGISQTVDDRNSSSISPVIDDGNSSSQTPVIAGVASSITVAIVVLIAVFFLCRRYRKRWRTFSCTNEFCYSVRTQNSSQFYLTIPFMFKKNFNVGRKRTHTLFEGTLPSARWCRCRWNQLTIPILPKNNEDAEWQRLW